MDTQLNMDSVSDLNCKSLVDLNEEQRAAIRVQEMFTKIKMAIIDAARIEVDDKGTF